MLLVTIDFPMIAPVPPFFSSSCYIRSICGPGETISAHGTGASDGAEPAQLHRSLRVVRGTGPGQSGVSSKRRGLRPAHQHLLHLLHVCGAFHGAAFTALLTQ